MTTTRLLTQKDKFEFFSPRGLQENSIYNVLMFYIRYRNKGSQGNPQSNTQEETGFLKNSNFNLLRQITSGEDSRVLLDTGPIDNTPSFGRF